MADRILLAHGAIFDMRILHAYMEAYGLDPMEQRFACTLQIAQKVWPSQPSYSLASMARLLGIQPADRQTEWMANACLGVALAALAEAGCESMDEFVESRRFEFGVLGAKVRQFGQWQRMSDDEYDEWIDSLPEVQQQHFALVDDIDYLYDQRDVLPDALDKCIAACHRQISIAPLVASSMKAVSARSLPRHRGYERLATTGEHQNDYLAALKISRKAVDEGWAGDWEDRIVRLERFVDRQVGLS